MVTHGVDMLHMIESRRQTAVDMSNHVGLYAKQRYDIKLRAKETDNVIGSSLSLKLDLRPTYNHNRFVIPTAVAKAMNDFHIRSARACIIHALCRAKWYYVCADWGDCAMIISSSQRCRYGGGAVGRLLQPRPLYSSQPQYSLFHQYRCVILMYVKYTIFFQKCNLAKFAAL